ncbi:MULTISPECIES: glycerophosphodiester phosphodiesterase family protein [unclassified Thermosipho (in: thermotogales)]|uniref:glycerophosphodiester phosphodiesterase family protein n=1 Tax=unclassified Thermosipho (in: thermotogales) TaxID=2676525 RepID=UPI000984FEB2|nr:MULTISPECIES: glycerophosphodiester phosphodiesterase family protein [unclassified Thermosipho (in: thermotogales)]MBT1247497.1 glycerophosphodiester phosphodiesterase [Thermosipho sp. 1244]OOC46395.1 glycerophosphodiester phosphodiesterase [Thermosipho sp. 1223]
MKVLGHRGYAEKFIENTLESFDEAIKYGADGVELDVYCTKDGEVIVTHDEDLKRVFNVNLNVKKCDIKSIKEKADVPTLNEVFEIIPKDKVINVEIKDFENAENIVKYVIEENRKQQIIFSSFEHEIIKELSGIYKSEKFGLLFDERHKDLTFEDIKKLFTEANIYSAHIPIDLYYIDKEKFLYLTNFLRSIEKKLVIWTVNKIEEIEFLRKLADYVITDCVETIVNYLKK